MSTAPAIVQPVSTKPITTKPDLNNSYSNNFGSISSKTTSNTTPISSSDVFASSTGSTILEDSASSENLRMNTSNPSERINPFDKSSTRSDSVTSSPPLSAGISRKSESDTGNSTLDDLTKNRFEKYQGVQNQTTGRYVPSTTLPSATTASDYYASNTNDLTKTTITTTPASKTYSFDKDNRYEPSKYTDTSSTYVRTSSIDNIGTKTEPISTTNTESSVRTADSTKSRTDAAKYSFGTKQYTSGSMSDAELIFGSKDIPACDRTSSISSFDRGNSTQRRSFSQDRGSYATSVDSSDNIFANKRDHFFQNRSLSVSSDKSDTEFPPDSGNSPSYRIYEGIQNEGFQDFDSPVKTSAPTAPISSVTGISYTGSSYRSGATDDDDYDLK